MLFWIFLAIVNVVFFVFNIIEEVPMFFIVANVIGFIGSVVSAWFSWKKGKI